MRKFDDTFDTRCSQWRTPTNTSHVRLQSLEMNDCHVLFLESVDSLLDREDDNTGPTIHTSGSAIAAMD